MSIETDYVEETDTFLRRLRDGEFVFTSKATEVTYPFRPSMYDNLIQLRLKTMPLSDCLNNALRDYNRGYPEEQKKKLAKECHDWIQLVWLNGAIQESQGLTKKVETLMGENAQLQKKLEELSDKYLKAITKIEKYKNDFPFLKKDKQ
jgi:predicted RNase H-like nuclease (RuvC/YqgF family)